MEKITKLPILLVALAVITFSSCKKEATKVTSVDDSASAQDNASLISAFHSTTDIAAAVAGGVTDLKSGTIAANTDALNRVLGMLCGVKVTENGNTKVITFDGTTECNGFIRSGSIIETITGESKWEDFGAILTITWDKVKITDVATGDWHVIYGQNIVGNETGGLAWKVLAGLTTNQTISYRAQTFGQLNTDYSNGMSSVLNIDQSRSWTSDMSSGSNRITEKLFCENSEGIIRWGIDKYGTTYNTTLVSPILSDNNPGCMYQPYSGTVEFKINDRTTTTVYGTDATGKPIGSATECGLGYYITVNVGGRVSNHFVPYAHYVSSTLHL